MGLGEEKKQNSGYQEWSTPQGQYYLRRNGMGPVDDLMDGELKLESLSHVLNSCGLEAVAITAEPGVSCWEGKVDGHSKWYHILEGKLEVIANDVAHVLDEGDSIYLESAVPHIWRNSSKKTTRALVLTSPLIVASGRAGARA